MTHRYLAYLLVVAAFGSLMAMSAMPRRAKIAFVVGLALLGLQFALGIANVLLALPPLLREAHAANACATFLAFVTATALSALVHVRAKT